MIEIYRKDNKWRINIKNETLEFNDDDDFESVLKDILAIKLDYEPYKEK